MSFQSQWRLTIYTIVIALAIGGAAGVLGTALTSSYLSDYAVQLSELTAPLRLSQERPRNFPSSYKEAVEKFVVSSLPSIAEIYEGKIGSLGYTIQNRSSVGIVLTSDGWMAVKANASELLNINGIQVRIRGQMYPVKERLFDATTQMVFLKVEAIGLPVAAFGKGSETQLGEQIFVATGAMAFEPASVTQQTWPEALFLSSDDPNRSLEIDREFSVGDLAFNLNGEIIGVVQTQDQLLPIEAISPAIRSLLEKQKISRPSLGVEYVDLSHTVNIPTELSRSYKTGALLYGSTSVPRTGPAKDAGLQPNDILISVNGELMNELHGLDELIAQYRAGDRVQILFDRNGTQQTVEVVLGEKKE